MTAMLHEINKKKFVILRNSRLIKNVSVIVILCYFLVAWHFSGIIFDKKNRAYYPQFSKERDTYQINASVILDSKLSLPSCAHSQRMLIGIISRPSEIKRRDIIRNSWANNIYFNNSYTKVAFFIGKTKSKKVVKEMQKFRDVVVTNVHENYYNLSLKTFAIFDFAHKHCPQVECLIKSDSDNILNVAGFEALCQKQSVATRSSTMNKNKKIYPYGYIGGYCNVRRNIYRESRNKWHVPYYVYPDGEYPRYCSTGAYAYFGRNAWASIYAAVFDSQYFTSSNMRHLPEDVLFTGIFANSVAIPRIDILGFSFVDTPKIVCSEKRTMSYSIHLHNIKEALSEEAAIKSSTLKFLRFLNHPCTSKIN